MRTLDLPDLPNLPQPWAELFAILARGSLVLLGLSCLLFVVIYHRLADWQATQLGRNVMALMAALATLFGVAAVREFLPSLDHWTDVFRFLGYAVTAMVVLWRVYLLIGYQTRAEYGGMRDDDARGIEDEPDDDDSRRAYHRRECSTPPEGVPTTRE
jgi:uncharacterized membrane protein YjfL (UPF0719 family)